MPDSADRRAATRHGVVKNQASLQLVGCQGLREGRATLVNISQAGALIHTDERLALHQALLLRMDTPVKSRWVQAVTVRFGQQQQVGVAFTQRCPDDFLLGSTLGLDFSWGADIGEFTPDPDEPEA